MMPDPGSDTVGLEGLTFGNVKLSVGWDTHTPTATKQAKQPQLNKQTYQQRAIQRYKTNDFCLANPLSYLHML